MIGVESAKAMDNLVGNNFQLEENLLLVITNVMTIILAQLILVICLLETAHMYQNAVQVTNAKRQHATMELVSNQCLIAPLQNYASPILAIQ